MPGNQGILPNLKKPNKLEVCRLQANAKYPHRIVLLGIFGKGKFEVLSISNLVKI
jgi:hypothetical protein